MGRSSSRVCLLLCATAALLCPTALQAWTTPLVISGSGDVEPSVPKLARGADGQVHLAYRRKGPDGWQICYRFRSGAGAWGPIEAISAPWSDRPDIIEDAGGRPHLFYAGTDAGDKTDLFEAYKQGDTWTITDFSNTTTHYEDYARLATDSLGRIHLVHTRGTVDDKGEVIYRIWDGTWSGETVLGQINNKFYYHRPDISVDPGNNVHVTWCETQFALVYRKFNGTTWLGKQTLGTTGNFFSYPKIAAPSASKVVVVTFDQLTNATLKSTASDNGGTTWSALVYLNDGHYPNLECDTAGNAYLVYEWLPANYTGYRTWNGSTWSAAQQITPYSSWQGWPDVAVDTNGVTHVVYDDGSATIRHINSGTDTTPPGQVSGFTAVAGHSFVQLNWTNPYDPDFAGTMVRYKTTGHPTGPTDGTLLCNRSTTPGGTDGFRHSTVVNGTTYYYSAFTYDMVGNCSAGVQASATPWVPPDFDRDGDVDQIDFGHFQECLSGSLVPQNEPDCQEARLDPDDDVDQDDFAILASCLSGQKVVANPSCAG